MFMHQQSYDHPMILKTHFINKTKGGQLVAMAERVPPLFPRMVKLSEVRPVANDLRWDECIYRPFVH